MGAGGCPLTVSRPQPLSLSLSLSLSLRDVWDTTSRKILYRLPGHNGSVNEVVFHPKEPIIASASSDRTIFLGEIEP